MSEFSVTNGKLTCAFAGTIDTARAQDIERELTTHMAEEQPGAVVFDMAEVVYISSYFLRLCIKMTKAVGTDNFAVVKVKPAVKKIFKVSGLDPMLG